MTQSALGNYLYYRACTWNKVRLLVLVLATCLFRVTFTTQRSPRPPKQDNILSTVSLEFNRQHRLVWFTLSMACQRLLLDPPTSSWKTVARAAWLKTIAFRHYSRTTSLCSNAPGHDWTLLCRLASILRSLRCPSAVSFFFFEKKERGLMHGFY